MKRSQIILGIITIIVLCSMGFFVKQLYQPKENVHTESIAVGIIGSQILASGYITAENQATLHFPISGKVVYIPLKEGDSVYQGQTIASLDERSIEANIKSTVDAYQSQKTQFDIINEFNGNRGLNDLSLSTSAYRQLSTALNTLDQAKIAVTMQQIAQEQSVLTSPVTGVITHEDVTLPYQNITPATVFTVIDPTTMIFRANITDSDIDFIQIGSTANVSLSGSKGITFRGTIVKIFPTKITVSNSQSVYQVDIQSDNLKNTAKFDQTGTVLIDNIQGGLTNIIPTWTILGHQYVWVENNAKTILRQVVLGKSHGNMTEIISGLNKNDRVVTNPQSIAGERYQLL